MASIPTKSELFLDTSYAVALCSNADCLHAKALWLAAEISRVEAKLITTSAVLLEIGNSLARQRHRALGVQLLDSLRRDPAVVVHPVDEALFNRGFELFSNRTDKEWGLIDCISFTVMTDGAIEMALTADQHFQQFGFKALLRA